MTRARPRTLLMGSCLVLLAAVFARAAVAAPDDDDPGYDTAEVQRLSDEAARAYKALEFEKARTRLEKALAIAREGQPASNPVVAKIRLYLGMILFTGLHNTEAATGQFRVARRLDPKVTPPPGLFNPEVQALFDSTGERKVARADDTAPPAAGADRPAPASGAPTAEGASPAPLPAPAPVATADVDEEALLAGAPKDEAASAPAAVAPPPPPVIRAPAPTPIRARHARRSVASEVRSRDDDRDDDESSVERPVLLALSIGSGAGSASGPLDSPGIAPNRAPGRFGLAGGGQVTLTAGYFVSRSFLLALEGRLQLVTGNSPRCTADSCDDSPAFAAAGFARATYFLGDDGLRPFVAAGLGGGAIRQSVKLPGLNDCGADHAHGCATTVAGGPLLGSLGAGLAYDSGALMILFGVTANAGAPNLMLDVDLSLGAGVRF